MSSRHVLTMYVSRGLYFPELIDQLAVIRGFKDEHKRLEKLCVEEMKYFTPFLSRPPISRADHIASMAVDNFLRALQYHGKCNLAQDLEHFLALMPRREYRPHTAVVMPTLGTAQALLKRVRTIHKHLDRMSYYAHKTYLYLRWRACRTLFPQRWVKGAERARVFGNSTENLKPLMQDVEDALTRAELYFPRTTPGNEEIVIIED